MEPQRYRFEWRSAYMGEVDYTVYGDGSPYTVSERYEASEYFRSIVNGGSAEFERDVVASIGLLRREHSCDRGIAPEVVEAFNAWRARTHAEQIRKLEADPARYGVIAAGDPIRRVPAVLRGARYVIGTGWVVDSQEAARAA